MKRQKEKQQQQTPGFLFPHPSSAFHSTPQDTPDHVYSPSFGLFGNLDPSHQQLRNNKLIPGRSLPFSPITSVPDLSLIHSPTTIIQGTHHSSMTQATPLPNTLNPRSTLNTNQSTPNNITTNNTEQDKIIPPTARKVKYVASRYLQSTSKKPTATTQRQTTTTVASRPGTNRTSSNSKTNNMVLNRSTRPIATSLATPAVRRLTRPLQESNTSMLPHNSSVLLSTRKPPATRLCDQTVTLSPGFNDENRLAHNLSPEEETYLLQARLLQLQLLNTLANDHFEQQRLRAQKDIVKILNLIQSQELHLKEQEIALTVHDTASAEYMDSQRQKLSEVLTLLEEIGPYYKALGESVNTLSSKLEMPGIVWNDPEEVYDNLQDIQEILHWNSKVVKSFDVTECDNLAENLKKMEGILDDELKSLSSCLEKSCQLEESARTESSLSMSISYQ